MRPASARQALPRPGPRPGSRGCRARRPRIIRRLAPALLPIAAMASGDGPMKTSPARGRPARTPRSRPGSRSPGAPRRRRCARAASMIAGMRRYDCAGSGSPMQTAWSACGTWQRAGIGRGIHRHRAIAERARALRITRSAISPRLATRILWNGVVQTVMAAPPRTAWAAAGCALRLAADRQHLGQHGAGVARVDHAIVEQPRAGA